MYLYILLIYYNYYYYMSSRPDKIEINLINLSFFLENKTKKKVSMRACAADRLHPEI